MKTMVAFVITLVFLAAPHLSSAFLKPSQHVFFVSPLTQQNTATSKRKIISDKSYRLCTKLQMGSDLDLVTYLRTEWVSAALCTNQIPRSSTSVLQIGVEDGRAVNFVPRSVQELITSSIDEDGLISIGCRRQLKQQTERRGSGLRIKYIDQAADNLKETGNDSVDAVISLQAVDKMGKNGMDWKKSIREVARVLKPGGRFLFVERTDLEGDNFLEEVMALVSLEDKPSAEQYGDQKPLATPIFEMVGYDDVDFIIVPHVAGVVEKAMYVGMTPTEVEEKKTAEKEAESKDRMAELSINAFERGLKRRKKKKKKKIDTEEKK